jgi:DnaJ-class molecular chaperone
MSTCQKCKGSGVDSSVKVKPGEESTPCSVCGGNGKLVDKEEVKV